MERKSQTYADFLEKFLNQTRLEILRSWNPPKKASYTLLEDLCLINIFLDSHQNANLKISAAMNLLCRSHDSIRSRYKDYLQHLTPADIDRIFEHINENGHVGFLHFAYDVQSVTPKFQGITQTDPRNLQNSFNEDSENRLFGRTTESEAQRRLRRDWRKAQEGGSFQDRRLTHQNQRQTIGSLSIGSEWTPNTDGVVIYPSRGSTIKRSPLVSRGIAKALNRTPAKESSHAPGLQKGQDSAQFEEYLTTLREQSSAVNAHEQLLRLTDRLPKSELVFAEQTLMEVLNILAKWQGLTIENLIGLLDQVSGDFDKLQAYFQSNDDVVLWTDIEDFLLLKDGPEGFQGKEFITRRKGQKSVDLRRLYLSVLNTS